MQFPYLPIQSPHLLSPRESSILLSSSASCSCRRSSCHLRFRALSHVATVLFLQRTGSSGMGIFSWQPRRACLWGQHHVKHAPMRSSTRGISIGQILDESIFLDPLVTDCSRDSLTSGLRISRFGCFASRFAG